MNFSNYLVFLFLLYVRKLPDFSSPLAFLLITLAKLIKVLVRIHEGRRENRHCSVSFPFNFSVGQRKRAVYINNDHNIYNSYSCECCRNKYRLSPQEQIKIGLRLLVWLR